jgi:hypothetical protein
MGLFDRRRAKTAPQTVSPPARGACSCPEHIETLLDLPVPMSPLMRVDDDDKPLTVRQLLETAGGLSVEPGDERWLLDPDTGRDDDGPYEWTVGYWDDARVSYDDDAQLPLDQSLLSRPGIERVAWEDREIMHVGAPTLCRDGVLAAAARALLDDRVRSAEG